MNVHNFIFYTFMALAAVSSLGMLFSKNIFKSALLLLACLLSLAAIYVFAFAEFVAITQLMIYAGGVVVVIIFGIMLTTKISEQALKVENAHVFLGILSSAAILILLLKFLSSPIGPHGQLVSSAETRIEQTGIELMTTFVLPFELAGILLLIALIGAALLSTSSDTQQNS